MTDPVWTCERCSRPLRGDGDLVLLAADVEALGERLRRDPFRHKPLANWHVLHDRCRGAGEGFAEELRVPHHDIDTWLKVARWTAHWMEKPWIRSTDWAILVDRLSGGGPLRSLGTVEIWVDGRRVDG